MLDILKVIVLGIVEGITEWLPVSSTGHLILVGDILKPGLSEEFMEMFNVVIQLGAIMAVVVLYFHKLNPFSPTKTKKQKMLTWQMWFKVVIASVPAALIGLPFNDILDELFYKPLPVAVMLIVYGVLFIIVENRNAGSKPSVRKISELTIPMLLIIGVFQWFAEPYIMTNGGPDNQTMFYSLYLYQNAFSYFKMGYASAMAWVLLLIALAIILVLFKVFRFGESDY